MYGEYRIYCAQKQYTPPVLKNLLVSRQRQWQLRRKAEGNCVACGKPRGESGTKEWCVVHAKAARERRSRYYHKNREKVLAQQRAYNKKTRDETGVSVTRRYQLRNKAAGKCEACGQPRGESGSTVLCALHLKLRREYAAKWYYNNIERKRTYQREYERRRRAHRS
jgi:hypothetical protein